MKKIFTVVSVFAVIAAAVSSCEKEQETKEIISEGVEINIIADNSITLDSKTAAVDGAIPSVKWLSTDQLTIYEIVDGSVNQTTTSTSTALSDGDYVATFKATIPGADPAGTSYKYTAVYPATAVSEGSGFYRLTMPNAQTLIGNNFSADSDIMISEVLDHGDSRVTSSENISFQFKRIGTAVKMTLKGITADEKIKSVTITAPHYIAGRVKYVRETSSLVSDSWHYSGQGQNTITLTVPEITATGTDVLWFRVLAAEKWANGEELSIEVETDKANYYRNGLDVSHAAITLTKDINFVDGGLTAFGVNLASYRVAKPEAVNYTLVESASNIVDGAEYLITNAAGTYAAGAFSSSYFGQTAVTATAKVINITSEPVTVFTLEDAGSSKFYIKTNDGDYIGNPAKGSLTKGSLEGDTYKWTVATDAITNVGSSTFKLQYNSGASRFTGYAGTMADVKLYVNLNSILPLGISFDDASYEFVVNSTEYDNFSGQAVTKSGGDSRDVTYSVFSDDDSIISTINASTGAITLSGNIGTATIKATVGATAGVYKAGSVTYTVTVTAVPKTYVRATSIVSGSSYLIIAKYSDVYYMANPVSSGTYGYLSQTVVEEQLDGSIRIAGGADDNLFTFTTSGVGYTIQQSDDKYIYQNGSYKTFQLSDSAPASVWSATKQGDDTFKIQYGDYWMQYSSSYSSYGVYNSTQANSALPYLYLEDDGSPRASGTPIVFSVPTGDAESSTLSSTNLTGVTYSLVSKPAWIDEVEIVGNTATVTSLDNKTTEARNGVIVVSATGNEGSCNANIEVSQPASIFSASSTADLSFAWDDYTNAEIKRITITSTYVLTDANAAISGTNAAKFEAAITRNGSTDEYYLDVNVVEDNESGADYEAAVTVSRDGLSIPINLSQAYEGGGGTLTIDFEDTSSSYSDWTFTNMTSQQTGSITAHGGTYYGTTGGKATASIQTKEKISSPGTLTFYVSKQSTNTTASNWKVQTSANGSTWTDRKTQSATSMSKGSWTEVSIDLSSYSDVYVRVYYDGSTAVRNIDDLSLTYN